MCSMYGHAPPPAKRPRPIVDDSTPATRALRKRLRDGESPESVIASLPTVARAKVPRVQPGDRLAVLSDPIDNDSPWSGPNLGETGGGALLAADIRPHLRVTVYRIVD